MRQYKPSDYMVPGFVDNIMRNKQDVGVCLVDVADETEIKMPMRMFVLNVVLWEPMIHFGIVPEFSNITNIKSLTNSSISVIHTKLYDVILDKRPDVYYLEIVRAFADNVDRLYRLICTHMGNYMPSIDILNLARLVNTPGIKELTNPALDIREGPDIAECRLKALGDMLLLKLRDPKTPNNCLYPYMRADTLKSNQIPQAMLAYGTRSDVDDTMRKHIITESTLSGLRSPEDYATEYLSAKKAIYFSRDAIRKTQYFGRKLRLACSMQHTIYPGSCGPTIPIPYVIPAEFAKNYIHKMVIENGRRVVLTADNIPQFINRRVELITPLACRHTTGVCEHCAGYGRDRLLVYMPPNIHIGMLAETWVASEVSQKVLSTKHLLETTSMVYNLPPSAAKFFFKDETSLYWNPEITKSIKQLSARIPLDALGLLTDLSLATSPTADAYSRLPYIEILRNGEVVDTIHLEVDTFIPYLSEATLTYLHSIYGQIFVDDTHFTFPLAGLDTKQEFMKFTILNDGMLAYTKRVSDFLGKSIAECTSCTDLLRTATEIIHTKSSVGTFYIEMVLKSFLITDANNFQTPAVSDHENIHMGTLDAIINERTISAKLAFEKLQQYLNLPKTSTTARPVGLFAPFFGL